MYALQLTPYVLQRPGELRQMEWAEVNFDKAVWKIPVTKMKMRQRHSVPLSRQAFAILQAMRFLSGSGRYVFPSIRTRASPISENTINAALRRMGYQNAEIVTFVPTPRNVEIATPLSSVQI